MKTVKQHLESIKDDKVRGEALANMKRPDDKYPTIRSALVCAFDWHATPQGLEYWRSIWKSYTATEQALKDNIG